MALPAKQETWYTFADVLTWDEAERIELIDGAPFMMALPSRRHQGVNGELFAQLHTYLKGKNCKVYQVPFGVRLFEKDGDAPEDVDTMVEPDLAVVCDRNKLDDYGCKGAPDMVVEVLSPSSDRRDRFTKFNLYQRAGVREYWIVDPAAKSVQVFVLEDGHYAAKDFGTAADADQVRVNVLDGCVIDLTQVFAE